MALTKPFAENGDKTPIELNPQADGSVSYENGFGARYSMPIKAVIDSSGNITKTGGLQIQRPQMNQILYDLSSAIIENQENTGDLSNLQTNAKDNLVNAINEVNSSTPKLLTQNLEWTVGTGGKFSNINDALSEASKYLKVHKVTGSLITLKLKSGFVFNEKIHIQHNDLSFVIIESEDAEVGINASSSVFGRSETNILFRGNYAKLPVLRIMVDLDTKSAGNKKVVLMQMHQSNGIISRNAGCKNAAWDAIMVEQASTLYADGCIIENAGYDGIFCTQGSIVSANGATIKGTARYGILTRLGGYVTASNANLVDQTQGTLLQCEIGIIYANGLVTTGSTATETNITPNQPTSSGIIFK